MKGLSILGSTGSIGTQTLEVVAASPERLSVAALAAHTNDALLEAQIRNFGRTWPPSAMKRLPQGAGPL